MDRILFGTFSRHDPALELGCLVSPAKRHVSVVGGVARCSFDRLSRIMMMCSTAQGLEIGYVSSVLIFCLDFKRLGSPHRIMPTQLLSIA